jgi:hypothetical protein
VPRHEEQRVKTRRELTALLKWVNAKHRKRVVAVMGFPPDVSRVPASLWAEMEAEATKTKALFAFLFLLGEEGVFGSLTAQERALIRSDDLIPAFDGQLAREQMAEDSARYAENRSREFAEETVRNTRDMLGRLERSQRQKPVSKVDWAGKVESVLGADRAEQQAITETTRGIVEGEKAYWEELKLKTGYTLLARWIHPPPRPPGHAGARTRPCPVCTPLLNLTQNHWPAVFATGPPAHPNCDCSLDYALISKFDARNLPVTGEPGPSRYLP